MTDILSDRIRAGSEAAPWVIESVRKLESEIAALKQKLFKAETERGVMIESYDECKRNLDALKQRMEDCEEVDADHKRLVRELDVLLNGNGAAKQASLCDIVCQLKQSAKPFITILSSDPYDDRTNGAFLSLEDAEKFSRLLPCTKLYLHPSPAKEDIDRAIEMLMVCSRVIREQGAEMMWKYDEAECDGLCIADDCETAATMLKA